MFTHAVISLISELKLDFSGFLWWLLKMNSDFFSQACHADSAVSVLKSLWLFSLKIMYLQT